MVLPMWERSTIPTSTSPNFAFPTARESTFANDTETLPPALWPSFEPIVFSSSCLARSDASSEVPAPVSRIKSNGPRSFTWTGRRMSGCAPPARRNLTFALLGEIVAAVIRATWVRPYATIPICCLRQIAEAGQNELRRSLALIEERLLYRTRLSESMRAASPQIVCFCLRHGSGRDQPEQ